MILAVKTATGVAELRLLTKNGRILAEEDWPADRQMADGLLKHIQMLLEKQQYELSDLSGLVVFSGPGSFTGLRIGITVMNTLSYALNIPIVDSSTHHWQAQGVAKLRTRENQQLVLPNYGAEAHITSPKR